MLIRSGWVVLAATWQTEFSSRPVPLAPDHEIGVKADR